MGMGVFTNAWTDLYQIWWGHCMIIATHQIQKNGEDILLGFQTTAAHIRALLSDKAKTGTF